MLYFNSLGRSIPHLHSPMTHVSTTDSRLLLTNVVGCACTFCPPTTLQVKTATPRLVFVCSLQRVLSIEELQINVDDDSDNQSETSVDSSDYLNGGDGVVGLSDSLEIESLSRKAVKERMRRFKIGLANKGRVPWNKGRKHSAETRERIKRRTSEALREPKVRKKMAEHPRFHSDKIKEKISYSLRRVWQERLKSKRFREQIFLSWEQCIANAAKKGGCGQEELDWDSYNKIKEQLELQQLLQAEEKEKEKLMAIARAEKFIQSWSECLAKEAKKGGSGEKELDWDSYEKIQEEMFLLNQIRRTTEKAKAKERARTKAEKEARIKAIKKINISKNINSEVAREGGFSNSIYPTYNKLDLEVIKREKLRKEASFADRIQAARLKKGNLH
ncbi:uncharacterized protein LOC130749192 isoform X2 [Lotus japonicus]|uniref:uncharacterized protein LOC130749192 isoform X2 n=1 Tax=Lotus japonicus TaxID=34305 RepID=UPI00258DDDA0|nr:uncharacterized protein LOC130749192 isoform X2 [Lotus japonicus]